MTSTTVRRRGVETAASTVLSLTVLLLAPIDAVLRDGPVGTAMAQKAEDSPQWRGPNRDGKSPGAGLAEKWNKDGPPRLWTARVGLGFSAPAVEAGVVYVTGHVGKEVVLVALDLKTGKLKWRAKVGDPGKGGGPAYVGARSTPTVDCDDVYVIGDLGDVVKFDKKTGKEKWRKHLVDDFKGTKPNWDFAESVLVDGDNVIVTPGGTKNTMVALKKTDGSLVWSGKVPDLGEKEAAAGYGSAIRAQVNGKAAYVTTLHFGRVIAFDAATGAHLFTNDVITSDAAVGTCSAVGDRVLCNCGYSGGGAAQLDVSGAKPKVVWKVKELNDKTGSAIKLGDRVFGTSDGLANLYAVDWKTGKLLNPGRDRLLGNQSAGMTVADGKLILVYANGVVALWSAEDTPKQISNFILQGADARSTKNRYTAPVVVGTRMLVHFEDRLTCFNLDPAANKTPGEPLGPGAAPPEPVLDPDFDFEKFTGFKKNGAIEVKFKTFLGEVKGTGKITDIDPKTMKWTALFGDKKEEQPLGGAFGKDFQFTFTHDGKGTGKFIAASEVRKAPNDFKLLGPIGTKDKKIFADWFTTDDPKLALGPPYAKSVSVMKGTALEVTIEGETNIVITVTPK
jgi:outer membrane protein assembly factor BamB